MFKKAVPEKERTKLEARVAKIPTAELVSWAEQALFGLGRSLSAWQRGHDAMDLEEAVIGADALQAVMKELKSRHNV